MVVVWLGNIEVIVMSTALAFDTLRYSKRLREVGVPDDQAEIQAEELPRCPAEPSGRG